MNGTDIVNDCFGFEGVEKKLEIDFNRDPSNPEGLRTIPQKAWEEILDIIKCQIISSAKNKWFDSYVLSESSLFVYPHKVIVKTCGTTVLLSCLDQLLETVNDECGLSPEFVFFSRKNFLYPDKQPYPHSNLDSEIDILNRVFDGNCYTLGPHTGDHWVFYFADLSNSSESILHNDQTFEILMTELDEDVMNQFYANDTNILCAKEVTRSAGISDFLPGAITDEKMFEPCGYSVNGLSDDAYFTIHITPEPHCSFVSFETNAARKNYSRLTSSVVSAFRPGKFSVTLFADSDSLCGSNIFNAIESSPLERLGYVMKNKTYSEYSSDGSYRLVYLSFESTGLDNGTEALLGAVDYNIPELIECD